MRRDLGKVEHDTPRIYCVGIGRGRIGSATRQISLPEYESMPCARNSRLRPFQILQGNFIHREPADQCPPFGGHVGDAESCIHAERRDARPGNSTAAFSTSSWLYRPQSVMITSLPRPRRRKFALQYDLDGARDLPPEFARRPDGGGVGTDHRRADRAQGTVHVRMRIGGHDEGSGQHVSLLHHDLVADAGARRDRNRCLVRARTPPCCDTWPGSIVGFWIS